MNLQKLFCALLLAPTLALAVDTAYSPVVGGMTINAAANSDRFVSTALARPASWTGAVSSVSAHTISAASSPGWTASAFVPSVSQTDTFYVRMLSGAQRGQYFVVTANTSDVLTVDNAGIDLTTIVAGDTFELVPFWTLATLFPPDKAGSSFIASTSSLARQTEILFYDATTTGINRAPSSIFYFLNGAWRKTGTAVTNSFNNTIIFPDAYVIQRNKAAATTLVHTGRVQRGYVATILEAVSGAQNDNYVALSFPVDLTLNQTGLATSGFTASTSSLNVADQLLWFDPTATGTNRAASGIYYYLNGGWRKRGSPVTTDFGSSVVIPAGTGFVVRKAASGSTASWVFATNF